MPDETKRIEGLHGPYAGKHIDLPSADADAAISEGWARDPYAAIDPSKPQPEFNAEKYDAMLVNAEKAARKIRGEDDKKAEDRGKTKSPDRAKNTGVPMEGASRSSPASTKSDEAASSKPLGDTSSYQTRTSTSKTPSKE